MYREEQYTGKTLENFKNLFEGKLDEENRALPPTAWKVYNSNTTVGGGVCG